MQSGIYFGYAGLVDGIVGRIKKEYGKPDESHRHRRPWRRFM